MSGAYTLFYASMPFVSVSEASACFFVAPVFVCLFAAVLLGEKIGFWRIGAVFMGLIGVLVVIQPGFDGFKPSFLPVCAGAFYALAVIITRGFCNEETSFSLMIIHNFFYAMLGSILVSFLTISPFDPNTVISNPFFTDRVGGKYKNTSFLIGLTSLTHILAMSSSIVAYQNSEASFLAPLEYSYLIFAAFIDLVIWDFVPSGSQILGALVIVISGATIAWREWSKK